MFPRRFTNIMVGLIWLSVNCAWQRPFAQINDYRTIRLRQYNVSQGLPSDACTKLYKDSYGFLWISTYYGVSIFNGSRFTNLPVYSAQKGYYLGDCPYTFLQLSRDSMLISCSDGLYVFEYASNHITKVPGQPAVPPRARISILGFNLPHSGVLVKIGAVIYSFDRGLRQTGSMECANENIEMSAGNSFYAPSYFYYANSGHLISLDTESGKADTLLCRPGERGGMIVKPESSAYLIATSTAVLIMDAKSGKITRNIPLPPMPRGLFFIPFCVKKDPNGNFWIGGRANLFIYFPATETVIAAGTSFADSIANKAIIINDIVQDTDGVFLATINNGVLKYDNRFSLFEDFHLDAAMNNSVYPGMVTGARLLCSPNTGGILRFDLNGKPDSYRLYPVSRKYGDITAMEPLDDHYLWLIFRDKFKLAVASLDDFRLTDYVFPVDSIGEAYFNKIDNKFPRIDLQPLIRKIGADSFYYAIRNYLYLIRGNPGDGFHFSLVDSIQPTAYISAICISSDRRITIGTGDFELFELSRGRLLKRFSPGGPIALPPKSICADDGGNIYLITVNGLYILDKNYKLRRHLTDQDIRIFNNVLYAGTIDRKGLLWMAANGGLIAYDTRSERIYNFSSDRLLHGREFNSRSVFADSLGNVFFGGSNGVTEVHTQLIAGDGADSKLYFEMVKDLDSVLHFGIMPGSFGAQNAFPYNKNNFSFSIGTLSYQQLEDIDYRYRLDGFDTAWSPPTENYTVSYINLPPGTYRFRAGQSYTDATPGKEISYSFQINKPYWQQFWFIAIVGLSAACLLTFIIRYVMDKRLEHQRIEASREMALRTERERISQELHDDLGSGLTSIRLLAKGIIAKQQTDGKTSGTLQNIAKISSELIDQMSEIVWLMNHMRDTMNGLLAHLRAYMAEYLQRTEIAVRLHFSNEIQVDTFISGRQRRSILLIIKEAFHNMVKHSRASEFSITCSADEKTITLLISDNGIGLPESSSLTGNGLNNIRKNVTAINGKVLFESGTGTHITVTIPTDEK